MNCDEILLKWIVFVMFWLELWLKEYFLLRYYWNGLIEIFFVIDEILLKIIWVSDISLFLNWIRSEKIWFYPAFFNMRYKWLGFVDIILKLMWMFIIIFNNYI